MKFESGNIYFNHIYVIQSLGDKDKKTGLEIHDDIITRKLWKDPNVKSEFIDINSKSELNAFFEHIIFKTKSNGLLPYIHFETHGNKNGLILKSDEVIGFVELFNYISAINILSGNNLFISVAACWGGHIQFVIDVAKPCPFRGFIGPMDELSQVDVLVCFTSFFEELLVNHDFNLAIKSLNLNNENFIEFHHLEAEDFFNLLKEIEFNKYKSNPNFLQNIITKYTKHQWKYNEKTRVIYGTRARFMKKFTKEVIKNNEISIEDIWNSIRKVFLYS